MLVEQNFAGLGGAQKNAGAAARLGGPFGARAEHHPSQYRRTTLKQFEQQAGASDLDVVAVRAEAQDVQRFLPVVQPEAEHVV
ncbi:MAG: hypothetical protein OHK0044_05830 [Burkholderiaceae bacterium]